MKMVLDGADGHRQSVLALIRTKSTLKAASIACGRNHGYFHQYLFQSKPRFLPEDVRIKLAQYLGIAEHRLREPELLVSTDVAASASVETRSRLMVYGRASNLEIDMTSPVAETERPAMLAHVIDAFAAYVHDAALSPCLPVGSLVYVDPGKPLRPGDFVLVKRAATARIAVFRDRNAGNVVLDFGGGREESMGVGQLTAICKIVSVDYP